MDYLTATKYPDRIKLRIRPQKPSICAGRSEGVEFSGAEWGNEHEYEGTDKLDTLKQKYHSSFQDNEKESSALRANSLLSLV